MGAQDKNHWKELYEVNEKMLLKAMVDLDNYRELVQRLKADVVHYKSMYKDAEEARLKKVSEIKQKMVEFLTDDYYCTFLN